VVGKLSDTLEVDFVATTLQKDKRKDDEEKDEY
jgi:hypothetical protein